MYLNINLNGHFNDMYPKGYINQR